MKGRAIGWLLRSYPPAWRLRYGAELAAVLEADVLTARACVDVVRSGIVERLRGGGLVGDDLPADDQIRSGALVVLCAWTAFVVAGCGFQKVSEHWQDGTRATARGVPNGAFDVLVAAAAAGSVVAAAGASPGFILITAFMS